MGVKERKSLYTKIMYQRIMLGKVKNITLIRNVIRIG